MSNPMIENLRSQYLSLGSRDRLAVGVLLVFFGILTFYFAIWQPLHDFKVSSQDELNRQSEMLQGMRETAVPFLRQLGALGRGRVIRSVEELACRFNVGQVRALFLASKNSCAWLFMVFVTSSR